MQGAIKYSILIALLLSTISSINTTPAGAPPLRRNPRQLAHEALALSAVRASEASSYVSRLTSSPSPTPKSQGINAFQDCVALMTDSAGKLKKSLPELRRLGRAGSPTFVLCMSNIQTWVSAALTDQNMCLSSLSQAGVSNRTVVAAIRRKVGEVSRVTSSALALVNQIH